MKILQLHLGQAGTQQQLCPISQLERICSLSHVLYTLVAETEVKDNIFIPVPKYRYNSIPFREMRLDFFFVSVLSFFVVVFDYFFSHHADKIKFGTLILLS